MYRAKKRALGLLKDLFSAYFRLECSFLKLFIKKNTY